MKNYTIMLDIDMTSLFGHDGNDILCCLQMENRSQILPAIIPLLINPEMVKAIHKIEQKLGVVRIVLYTARYALIPDMKSASNTIHSFQASDEDLYFPKHIGVKDLPLFTHKLTYDKFRRLFLVRDAICAQLHRSSVEMVVTSRPGKCVVRTCGMLSPSADPENAFLFDDRVDLAGQYHVIKVPEFNAVTVECRDTVYALIGPAPLSETVVNFATTASDGHRCLGKGNTIVMNSSKKTPKEWDLSFLDSIEHTLFHLTNMWLQDEEDVFDPWCIEAQLRCTDGMDCA
jgi:hypothetical protein